MRRTKQRKTTVNPVWERAYRGHGYWRGQERVGVVRLDAALCDAPRYVWEVGHSVGRELSLERAKRAVERRFVLDQYQLSLF
jgi:hypothetical protein